MSDELRLTVREALERPLFASARVAAGAAGIDRQIRWVHILETPSFEALIHGQEMILTTGMSFSPGGTASVTFANKLIAQRASCLCIELGEHFEEAAVSDELLRLSDAHQFPLILFPSTVRFVDITQDLHSLIINRHHRMLQDLERVSREFQRLTLTSQGTPYILKLLQRSTRSRIAYLPEGGKPLLTPPPSCAEEQEALLKRIGECREELERLRPDSAPLTVARDEGVLVCKPVGALDQTWAYLAMHGPHHPQEYDYLLLDAAAVAVAQELLRTRYMEERRQYSENLWVDDLLNGRLPDESQIRALIAPGYKSPGELQYRVCLIELESRSPASQDAEGRDWESVLLHLSLVLRTSFERQGFRPLVTLKNNRLAVVAPDPQGKPGAKARIQQALEAVRELQSDERLSNLGIVTGVSRQHSQLRHARAAYEEAAAALALQAFRPETTLFYEDLGVFQLLLHLNDGATLQTFVRAYLGPLIDYDAAKGSELLQTLRVYLDHDGSKQIAAQKLFIVRQSLYYRLEKIAELLGDDFMSPEKRIAIQVALRAYQLLETAEGR